MIFRSLNLSNHTQVLGGSSGPALTMKGNMKKVKSLKDLSNLMETLGATKDEESGFTSWTLDCGPGLPKHIVTDLREKKEKDKE